MFDMSVMIQIGRRDIAGTNDTVNFACIITWTVSNKVVVITNNKTKSQ